MSSRVEIGITAFQHDSAVALLQDGMLLALYEEERFSRIKRASNFPEKALASMLSDFKVKMDEVEDVSFYMDPKIIFRRYALDSLVGIPLGRWTEIWNRTRLTLNFQHNIRQLESRFEPTCRVKFIQHHLCHAMYAYVMSGFNEAAVVSIDSIGEDITTSTYLAKGANLDLVDCARGANSIGYAYGAVTEHLGLTRGEGEGTVMAMAALGRIRGDLPSLIASEVDGRFQVSRDFFPRRYSRRDGRRVTDKFLATFGPPRSPGEEFDQGHFDLARLIQSDTERVILAYARRALRLTQVRNLCLSGGVALNSATNGIVREQLPLDGLFIGPATNDAGCAAGAAFITYSERTGLLPKRDFDAFIGPGFSDDSIRHCLEKAKVDFSYLECPAHTAAQALSEGKVIAWFQGRMESGPRALGHRSILADPRTVAMKDRVNREIKMRESFRPFAPAVLEDEVHHWFDVPAGHNLPFMLEVVRCRSEKLELVPAVCHVDGTARVQTVSKASDPLFFELLERFQCLTGVPLCLNTSFNVKGEPIVCSPSDALRCFYSTGLDSLIIGSFLVVK